MSWERVNKCTSSISSVLGLIDDELGHTHSIWRRHSDRSMPLIICLQIMGSNGCCPRRPIHQEMWRVCGQFAAGWCRIVRHVLVSWQKLCHNLISIFDWQDHIGVLIRIRLHCRPSAHRQGETERSSPLSLCTGNQYALSWMGRLGVSSEKHLHWLRYFEWICINQVFWIVKCPWIFVFPRALFPPHVPLEAP